LQEWNAQIDLLKAKAKAATIGVKIEYYSAIDFLQHRQNNAVSKLQELKAAGDDAWEDLRTDAEKAWADVKAAYNKASSTIK
jgi:hypothetical protein